jgi:hypothetical protein
MRYESDLSETGVMQTARHAVFTRSLPRLRRVDAAGELFDLSFGRIQVLAAETVELLAPLPQLESLVEGRVAALEPVDDLLQLALGLLEGLPAQRVSSTRAPKPPSASSTSTRSPGSTALAERTICSCARTIA